MGRSVIRDSSPLPPPQLKEGPPHAPYGHGGWKGRSLIRDSQFVIQDEYHGTLIFVE